MMSYRVSVLSCCYAVSMLLASAFVATPLYAQPITTDSRIKTLVFNPNEVFAVTTHYGYQSNIEFGPKENIETISVGDRVAWQISPAGRRLFIRAMEENARTNMTVITNLHAYQFDLRSSAADAVFGSEELTYVVRFFYPEDEVSASSAPGGYSYAPPPPPEPLAAAPMPTSVAPVAAAPTAAFNYRYTFSGPNSIAPVKIYDDGKNTYFKFPAGAAPQISIITAKGETVDVPTARQNDGVISVNAIAPRFSVRQGADQVVVFNEANGVM